jgi:hypothetical protein
VLIVLKSNGEMALVVLKRVRMHVWNNQMCHLREWLKLFEKNVRLKKIQKPWLLGRLFDGSFVQSLIYVLTCHSFLSCRSLCAHLTVCRFAMGGLFSTNVHWDN